MDADQGLTIHFIDGRPVSEKMKKVSLPKHTIKGTTLARRDL